MGSNFLYLKINNDNAFDETINPQVGNAIIYLTRGLQNDFIWMAKDQNGKFYKLGSIASSQATASIAQITNVNEDGTVTTNTLTYQNGSPVLTKTTNTGNVYNFTGVALSISVLLPNEQESVLFSLNNIYCGGNKRIWSYQSYKLYYNIAYCRWQIQDTSNSNQINLIDYTTQTEDEPFDSSWANGSELVKK